MRRISLILLLLFGISQTFVAETSEASQLRIPASKLSVKAKITSDSKLNILVTGVKSTLGSEYAIVFCSVLVYEWGLADHLGGVYYEQGVQSFSVPVDLKNKKNLPTSFHLRNCKENDDASFAIHWTTQNSTSKPTFEKLKKLTNLKAIKSYVPESPDSEGYINSYKGVNEERFARQGKISGYSTLRYYASYPKDICKTTAVGADGRSIELINEYFDRLNGYGQANYLSDIAELIGYKITCIKSGEQSLESMHLSGK